MTTKNPAIGEIACPIPGCKQMAAVCRFQSKHQRDSGRRLAGKYYAKCSRHGRIGFDGAEDMQEWILNNARMYGAKPTELPPAAPASSPDEKPEAERRAPPPEGDDDDEDEPGAPAKKPGWGFF